MYSVFGIEIFLLWMAFVLSFQHCRSFHNIENYLYYCFLHTLARNHIVFKMAEQNKLLGAMVEWLTREIRTIVISSSLRAQVRILLAS